jgi:hypothetical protein
MLHSDQVEELISLVWGLDRAALIRQFSQYPASFPLDFTDEFFEQTPLDRLRHIFVALCLQNQRMPSLVETAA